MSTKRKFEEYPAQRSSRKRTRDDKDNEFTLFADASVDGCGMFAKLPKELFQKVCKFLFTRDILNMTEISKAMNKMISLDPQIMKSIKLRIPPHDKLSQVRFGQRIYPTIIYCKHSVNEFVLYRSSIKKIASEVKTISFAEDMSCTVAIKVLKMMPNIQAVLNFPGLKLKSHDIASTSEQIQERLRSGQKPLSLPFLKELKLNAHCGGETNIFANCAKLEILEGFAFNTMTSEGLKRILKIQTSLQSMSLIASNFFFANFDSSEMKFKLKSLSITFIYFDEETLLANFERFINPHRDTLVKLSANSFNLLPIFQKFSMLKEIEFCDAYLRLTDITLPTISSVEKITISNNWNSRVNLKLFDCFPSLKEFRGTHVIINEKWTHNGIEKIFMDSSYFLNFAMPKLRSIEFANMFFNRSIVKNCENVSEMRLDKCYYIGPLLASVTQQSKQLKILVLQNMTLLKGYKKYVQIEDLSLQVKNCKVKE